VREIGAPDCTEPVGRAGLGGHRPPLQVSIRRGGSEVLPRGLVRALRRGRRSHPPAARRRRYVGNGDGAARRPYLYAGSAKGKSPKVSTEHLQSSIGNLSGPPLPSLLPYVGGEGDRSSEYYGAGWSGGARRSQNAATGFVLTRRGGGLAARVVRALRRGRRSHPTAARRRRYQRRVHGSTPIIADGRARCRRRGW